ncbi:type II toxin-antitoxin system RelE family toxin [Ectothiorhodospira mobilis]|uniref:type II toxin-antitoxin system RelE family toxin n=1 Tax=Ectothiorhodospira mobilis TaxID=195064 RepID=UPI002379E952|nr:type II toxin-antitoxin system RelE/ParE family toxin [Ectothiorhodospira mobilis]
MHELHYTKAAVKALRKMCRKDRRRMQAALHMLAEDPDRNDLDTKPLQGRDGYRLRVGHWRALYRLENERLTLLILKVGPRGDVYK